MTHIFVKISKRGQAFQEVIWSSEAITPPRKQASLPTVNVSLGVYCARIIVTHNRHQKNSGKILERSNNFLKCCLILCIFHSFRWLCIERSVMFIVQVIACVVAVWYLIELLECEVCRKITHRQCINLSFVVWRMHRNGVKVQILARESFCFDGQGGPPDWGLELRPLAIRRIMSGKSTKYIGSQWICTKTHLVYN